MSSFSDEMKAVADCIIPEFGETITFTRTGTGVYDPNTGSVDSSITSTAIGSGVPDDYDTSEIDGDAIRQNDIKLYATVPTSSGSAFRPIVGDSVTVDSKVYRIMNARRYAVNSEDVAYELQLRV